MVVYNIKNLSLSKLLSPIIFDGNDLYKYDGQFLVTVLSEKNLVKKILRIVSPEDIILVPLEILFDYINIIDLPCSCPPKDAYNKVNIPFKMKLENLGHVVLNQVLVILLEILAKQTKDSNCYCDEEYGKYICEEDEEDIEDDDFNFTFEIPNFVKATTLVDTVLSKHNDINITSNDKQITVNREYNCCIARDCNIGEYIGTQITVKIPKTNYYLAIFKVDDVIKQEKTIKYDTDSYGLEHYEYAEKVINFQAKINDVLITLRTIKEIHKIYEVNRPGWGCCEDYYYHDDISVLIVEI